MKNQRTVKKQIQIGEYLTKGDKADEIKGQT